MENSELIDFIIKARKRGFSDLEIKEALLSNNWPEDDVIKGFNALKSGHHFKESVVIWLDTDVIKLLEKRAKKNMLNLNEQVEDILRRSVINQKPSGRVEKLDDMLVGLFSRKTRKK